MSVEKNKVVFRRFYDEVLNERKIGVMDELNDPRLVDHSRVIPQNGLSDSEAAKLAIASLHKGFPDISWRVDDMVAEGDRVVARWTAQGTQNGEFMGMPPTGKHVQFSGIEIIRIANDKAIEHWEIFDAMGLVQQLGVSRPG